MDPNPRRRDLPVVEFGLSPRCFRNWLHPGVYLGCGDWVDGGLRAQKSLRASGGVSQKLES